MFFTIFSCSIIYDNFNQLIINKTLLEKNYNKINQEFIYQDEELTNTIINIKEFTNAKKIVDEMNILFIKNDQNPLKNQYLLEDLKKIYKQSNDLEIFKSPEEELRNVFFYNKKTLVFSNFNIKSKFYTDELFLGYLDSLEKNFPGIIKLKKVTFKKIQKLDDEILNNAKNGKLTYLIDGEINFEWRSFKDIN